MALSLGIPFGLIIVVIGAILFFATNHKRAAKVILSVGAVMALLTFVLIILVVNSSM